MKSILRFLIETRKWLLIPFLVVVGLIVAIGVISSSPLGAFVYTLF